MATQATGIPPGICTVEILALADAQLKRKLADYRARMAADVAAKDRQIQPEPA
jgi:phosphoribosylcarboxyaminoimidazole (NCAIR) mutase